MKHMRRFTALVLALVMVFSLTVSASAATAQTVTVKLSPNITVTLDGEPQAMTDVKGNPVYPVLYGGTTYLPVRAVSNMLGLGVDWDQATQTVLLTTSASTEPAKSGNKAPADAKPSDITVTINPNITVKLDGETQKMTNVNGDPVYPMLYGGTTYLPVRAVSNMLGLGVDWEQATQTVLLTKSSNDATPPMNVMVFTDKNGKDVTVDFRDAETARKQLKALGWKDEFIERAINGPRDPESMGRLLMEVKGIDPNQQTGQTDPLDGRQTSENAKVLSDKHIGCEWGEIDWSTASDGYVRVKVDEKLIGMANYEVRWYDGADDSGYRQIVPNFATTSGWQNLPLWYSDKEHECVVTINVVGVRDGYYLSWNDAALQARFTATIDDPDNVWLLSNPQVDYENAPNACAKVKEITKNCKTDAEKITAVYNFVSSTITYDSSELNKLSHERDLNPDSILASKKGVCEHYAVLMTAMLRSIGVRCKFVIGSAYLNGKWQSHAWVAVSPETGTLNISGAGKDYAGTDLNDKPTDPTGWIRLDPTNAHAPGTTANDNNYRTSNYY